jgi:excinuclease ABC subunit C
MIGVYILKNKTGKIIYIGKSTDIKQRIKTHLKSSSFAGEIYKTDYIETQNEAEALIRESELIKKYKPRYNILLRDDKQYFYVTFTREKLPKLLVTHQPEKSLVIGHWSLVGYAGPFTDGKSLKLVLKYLRKAFPYYTEKHGRLPCSYCHIGLCPGPNPDILEYKKNITKIKQILNGKKPRVISTLRKEMTGFAENLEFEKAAKARNQISALENIFSHGTFFDYPLPPTAVGGLPLLKGEINPLLTKEGLGVVKSLEAYDISNIQGREPVASMIRFDNGKPNKSLYRKFRIRLPEKPNDTAMIREVIRRRLAHPEWPYPDLFLIDGGRGQLNAALRQCQMSNVKCQLASLAKRFNELYIPNRKRPIPLNELPERTKNLLMHARDEAHRFAISYHRKLHRKKSML